MIQEPKQEVLTAICNNPADDDVRLAFGKWLEKHGQAERAEFIYAQMLLETGIEQHDVPLSKAARATLEHRTAQLLRNHQEWAQPLAELGATDVAFRRGFPEQVTMPITEFLRNADRLFACAPVTSLRITRPMTYEETMA